MESLTTEEATQLIELAKQALIDFLLLHLSDMGQGIQKLSTIINSEI